jgi:hypothetical protein
MSEAARIIPSAGTTLVVNADGSVSVNVAAAPPPPPPPPPPPSTGKILWSTKMAATPLAAFDLAGGGEFDSGSHTPAVVVTDPVRGASIDMSVDTSGGDAGDRLFRWAEPIADAAAGGPGLYYSCWYNFPSKYVVSGWSNVMQWKSFFAGSTDPFWYLELRDRPSGSMYLRLNWWNGPIGAGPHAGETGGRTYEQAIANINPGEWTFIEAFLKSAGDFTGHLTIWQNGVQLFDLPNVRTRYAGGDQQWSVNAYGNHISPVPFRVRINDAAISTDRIANSA